MDLKLDYLAVIKSMKLKYDLSRENLMKKLSNVKGKKSPIDHDMMYLSDSEIWKQPDLLPGMAHWLNGRYRKEYYEIGRTFD